MAAEAQKLAGLICQTLEKIRNNECFDLFWQSCAFTTRFGGICTCKKDGRALEDTNLEVKAFSMKLPRNCIARNTSSS